MKIIKHKLEHYRAERERMRTAPLHALGDNITHEKCQRYAAEFTALIDAIENGDDAVIGELIAESIAERDDPMSAADLSKWFREECGREPTADEMEIMGPNTEEQIREQIAYYRE